MKRTTIFVLLIGKHSIVRLTDVPDISICDLQESFISNESYWEVAA